MLIIQRPSLLIIGVSLIILQVMDFYDTARNHFPGCAGTVVAAAPLCAPPGVRFVDMHLDDQTINFDCNWLNSVVLSPTATCYIYLELKSRPGIAFLYALGLLATLYGLTTQGLFGRVILSIVVTLYRSATDIPSSGMYWTVIGAIFFSVVSDEIITRTLTSLNTTSQPVTFYQSIGTAKHHRRFSSRPTSADTGLFTSK